MYRTMVALLKLTYRTNTIFANIFAHLDAHKFGRCVSLSHRSFFFWLPVGDVHDSLVTAMKEIDSQKSAAQANTVIYFKNIINYTRIEVLCEEGWQGFGLL